MLFDFLNKYGKRDYAKILKTDFHRQFTDDQRKAIMISLLIVANSDDEFHRKEEDLFKSISGQLDYTLDEEYVDEFFKMDRKHVYVLLNSLNAEQKNWYMVTLFSMIHVDGKPMDIEFQFAKPFLEKMGIDQTLFESTIKKSRLWRKSHPGDFLE